MSTSDWLEVSIDTTSSDVEALEQWLFHAGALSVTLQDSVADGVLEHAVLEPGPGEVRLWDSVRLIGLFAGDTSRETLENALHLAAAVDEIALPPLTVSTLKERQWERAWMDDFRPMRFGEHFWICPTTQSPPDKDAINLRLDPGMAFGTGTHATTAQCLRWMGRQTARTLRPLSGTRVIDYGCGSGVLAIAALLLGADKAWAVDIDPQALTATERNAADNGVADQLEVGLPDLVNGLSVELVLANILFRPLMDLADMLSAAVRADGRLLMSGILPDQMAPLQQRYSENFRFEAGQVQDGWALMSAIRR